MTPADAPPARRDGPPPLVAEGVRVRLGGVAIVDGATLSLAAGDLVLLTGPNGAGKSTLLRALVGLLPSSGDVAIQGSPPTSAAARRAFVFAPDDPALYEDLTLAEHVRFQALLYGRPEAEARTLALLDAFDLTPKLGEFPGTHSRGMRQKLSLALALGLAMPLTLLDEPFNGLDLASQAQLVAAIAAAVAGGAVAGGAAAGGAVFLTGHQRELGGLLGARVLVLRDGRLEPA
jgi:ABC-2 type transport system ATP-binding protein